MPTKSLLSDNPRGVQLLERTVQLLQSCTFKLDRARIAVFVCGGPTKIVNGQPCSWRAAFLDWVARQAETKLDVVLAEKAYDAAIQNQNGFLNIGDFEEILADLSDCILLFPESAGSHAEAGVFATSDKIHNKVLVANEVRNHNSSSFLSRGPLHSFGSRSRFSQAVILEDQDKHNHPAFDLIRTRIEDNALKNRTLVKWTSIEDVDIRERLALVLALVEITGIAAEEDLLYLLQQMKLAVPKKQLRNLLRILLIFKQIDSIAPHVYRFSDSKHFSVAIENTNGKLLPLQTSFRSYYLSNFPKLLEPEPDPAHEAAR